MGSLNKAIIMGRVGQKPEVRHTQGGDPVCNFSLATNEDFKNRSGEKQERTEWHQCVAWGRLAEVCGQYLDKGALVLVEGKLQSREWEKDGVKRKTTEVLVLNMQFASSKGDSAGDGGEQERQPARRPAPASPPDDGMGGPDDDIPF
jgi:single-strand DNA-binding protein